MARPAVRLPPARRPGLLASRAPATVAGPPAAACSRRYCGECAAGAPGLLGRVPVAAPPAAACSRRYGGDRFSPAPAPAGVVHRSPAPACFLPASVGRPSLQLGRVTHLGWPWNRPLAPHWLARPVLGAAPCSGCAGCLFSSPERAEIAEHAQKARVCLETGRCGWLEDVHLLLRSSPAGSEAVRRFGSGASVVSRGGVAQPGRALRSHRRSRGFKSHHLHQDVFTFQCLPCSHFGRMTDGNRLRPFACRWLSA